MYYRIWSCSVSKSLNSGVSSFVKSVASLKCFADESGACPLGGFGVGGGL